MQSIPSFSLSNNLGPLSKETPFLLFGPLPFIGCYLDIHCAELFAAGVNNVLLEIEWEAGLPQNFADYYQAYKEIYSFTNQSFQVNILLGKDFKHSSESINLYSLSLFAEDESTGHILTKSHFYLAAKDMILAAKQLSLNEGELLSAKFEWSIRIELISPQIGFGHKAYAILFPKIITNNSKWYKRKQKLPAVPLVPMVNQIRIINHLNNINLQANVQHEL